MLTINNLYAGYSKDNPVLKGIDLTVSDGEVVGILGRNGSGKSTLAKVICGIVPFVSGEIWLDDEQILGKQTYEIARKGVGFFLQGGRVFGNLTVTENLHFACSGLKNDEKNKRINEIRDWFEVLQKPGRLKMKATYLSGGEKHQLALAMILSQKPQVLILDEPSAGLASTNVLNLFSVLQEMKKEIQTILIIEQNVNAVLKITESIIVLQNGNIYNEG